ncbi:MAG: helicase-related protein [Candidatus Poseidoniaceae archaeon]|jgi:ERCC4-related helicase/ERCC4-type nuclease
MNCKEAFPFTFTPGAHTMLLNPRLETVDMAVVVHPFLNDGVNARAYQMMALRNALAASTLMVMPTGFGKTAVEWMAMAEALRLDNGKILLIAPTTGLVEQQQRMAREMLNLEPGLIQTYTGDITPAKRPPVWKKARIIMATSQVIRNDAMNELIDLSEVSLLIVDEAHHGTGKHAYAQVGRLYREAHEHAPLVLGATASPGSTEQNIMEVIRTYGFDCLDVSRKEDPMLQPYAVDMSTVPHRLPLPSTLTTLLQPLKDHFEQEAKHLQDLGFLSPTAHISGKMIDEAQFRASQAIQRRDVRGYDAARRIGDLRRTHILLDLIQTQGLKAALSFLDRAEEDGRTGERTTNRFVAKPAVHQFRIAAKDIPELHPKPNHVRHLVQKQIIEHPNSKIIVFTEYRDTVENIVGMLDSIENINPDRFIGQSGKGKRKGMTQKQQLEQLRRFRVGEINVLVATSVGEEGLDVPAAELVILYEPVPSAIRAIQRRGRTARQQAGTVHTLIAEGTRDEYVNIAAEKREKRMHRLLQRIRTRGLIPSRPPPTDEVFEFFSIQTEDEILSVPEFIEQQQKNILDELEQNKPTEVEEIVNETTPERGPPVIAPAERRHSQQMGLEQFARNAETIPVKEISKIEELRTTYPAPILDGQAHRHQENLSSAAASAVVSEMGVAQNKDIVVTLDHRESSSTLGPYLRSLGVKIQFSHLLHGDIRISDRILIERKTARDLVQSLTDGRLLHQCRRLVAAASRPMLLIEIGQGHGQFVHPNAVHGALAHVSLDLGIPIMMTKSPEESAHFLASAAQREHDLIERMASLAHTRTTHFDDERSLERAISAAVAEIKAIELSENIDAPLAQRWTSFQKSESVEVLSAIPGIGKKKAESLIDSFTTVSRVFAASVEELSACDGVGTASALTVFEMLHG